eukprot:1931751-Prymnesium_polylepis.1
MAKTGSTRSRFTAVRRRRSAVAPASAGSTPESPPEPPEQLLPEARAFEVTNDAASVAPLLGVSTAPA